jgi:hypothetical protein
MTRLVRYGLCCGPQLFQGDQVEEDCDGVDRCGDHADAADADARDGPPAAAAVADQCSGFAASSPSLASSSEEEYNFFALAVWDIRVLRDWRDCSSSCC